MVVCNLNMEKTSCSKCISNNVKLGEVSKRCFIRDIFCKNQAISRHDESDVSEIEFAYDILLIMMSEMSV